MDIKDHNYTLNDLSNLTGKTKNTFRSRIRKTPGFKKKYCSYSGSQNTLEINPEGVKLLLKMNSNTWSTRTISKNTIISHLIADNINKQEQIDRLSKALDQSQKLDLASQVRYLKQTEKPRKRGFWHRFLGK